MPSATERLSRRTTQLTAGGAGAGLALGLLEVGAAAAGGVAPGVVLARAFALDILLGLSGGFVLGLLVAAAPEGRGPGAAFARFLAAGPAGPRCRAGATVAGATAFLHGSAWLGTALSGRFHHALLAATLLLTLQGALLLPSVVVGAAVERLLAAGPPGRGTRRSAAVVVVCAASLGLGLGRVMTPGEAWAIPLVALVAWLGWSAYRWSATAGPPVAAAVALAWIAGVLSLAGLLAMPDDPAAADELRQHTVVAGRLAGAASTDRR